MNVYRVKTGSILPLGKQGENLARKIQFDISRWISTFGPGTVQLLHQRSGDEAPYPVAVYREGNFAVWTVTDADTAAPGTGHAELQYYVGDALAKSETWMTKVFPALGDAGETPPEAQQGWVDQVLQAGAAATEAAEKAVNAAVRQPVVGDNGNWWTWDPDAGAYADTGIYSGGDAPYIGANGNWYVGQTDTGVAATGRNGKTAYQYAVDGGYTGTEEAFASKMAAEIPTVDDTLTNPDQAADAAAVGERFSQLSDEKVNLPKDDTGTVNNGTIGQILQTNGDGSTEWVDKPKGGPALSVTNTATVGQTIRVSAVDENGQPTEWEAVDMASGGDMPLLYAATLEEAATTIIVDKDTDGNALSLSRWKICLRIPPEFADYATPIYIYCVDKDSLGFNVFSKNIAINDKSAKNIAIYESVSEHMTRGFFYKYDAINTSNCSYYENGVKSTAIKLYTYDADKPFPAGTFVEVYGK